MLDTVKAKSPISSGRTASARSSDSRRDHGRLHAGSCRRDLAGELPLPDGAAGGADQTGVGCGRSRAPRLRADAGRHHGRGDRAHRRSRAQRDRRRARSLPNREAPYGQPPVMLEEFFKCEAVVKADPGWRAAMVRRGLTDKDIELVQVDPFSSGFFDFEYERGARIVRAVSFFREHLQDNGYAHPIEGVVAVGRPDRRQGHRPHGRRPDRADPAQEAELRRA